MYDEVILKHYADVASKEGHLESCTMADDYIREIETKFIRDSIGEIVKEFRNVNPIKPVTLLDVGCGNGYTLWQLSKQFMDIDFQGIEFTPELRALANNRGLPCAVQPGDVRRKETLPLGVDIIIVQRVLINLLKYEDQVIAVRNMLDCLNKNGYLLVIEAFCSGLDNINLCRGELGLPKVPPAHHNLYLSDDFFCQFTEISEVETEHGPNVLSTHYFVSRVLHDMALAVTGSKFARNSLFVKFFDEALPLGVGQFSPLKCLLFKKK